MKSGTSYSLLNVDGKGRVHLPIEIRKQIGIEDKVMVEIENNMLVLKPVEKIEDPIAFLSSINIKTKKSPLEMKRESERVFG